jgi:hypothetical protein
MGASYADIVSAITDAKQKGYLTARVKFDALPKPGREYQLDEDTELPADFSADEAELNKIDEEEDASDADDSADLAQKN